MKIYIPFFLVILVYGAASAQQTNDTKILWRIETNDGNEYVGTVFKRDPEEIVLETENLGLITIRMVDVHTMEVVTPQQMKQGGVWTENPQGARYFWVPNGYGLKRGEGYYQNTLVLVNQASVGLSDHFSIGVGMVPLFLFRGPTPAWITPKFSIPVVKDKVNIGVGALIGTVLGEQNTSFGIAYGVTTFGSRDKNISLGVGYGFADGGWADTPTFSLSGMIRAGKRQYFVSENYLINTGDEIFGLLSFGGRTVWSRISLDYGGVLPAIDEETFVIPWVGITLPLGR
jgi:hypothetical protein